MKKGISVLWFGNTENHAHFQWSKQNFEREISFGDVAVRWMNDNWKWTRSPMIFYFHFFQEIQNIIKESQNSMLCYFIRTKIQGIFYYFKHAPLFVIEMRVPLSTNFNHLHPKLVQVWEGIHVTERWRCCSSHFWTEIRVEWMTRMDEVRAVFWVR